MIRALLRILGRHASAQLRRAVEYAGMGHKLPQYDRWGDRMLLDPRRIEDEITNSLRHNRCLFCGTKGDLFEGPRAPGCVNLCCGTCGAMFNDGGFTADLLRLPLPAAEPIPEIRGRFCTVDVALADFPGALDRVR